MKRNSSSCYKTDVSYKAVKKLYIGRVSRYNARPLAPVGR